jgi:hypothetical protein
VREWEEGEGVGKGEGVGVEGEEGVVKISTMSQP